MKTIKCMTILTIRQLTLEVYIKYFGLPSINRIVSGLNGVHVPTIWNGEFRCGSFGATTIVWKNTLQLDNWC